jgi:hypothetical protein
MSRTTVGNLLLIVGLSAWAFYYGLKFLAHMDLPFGIFLTWHLLGVIPGATLRGKGRLKKLVGRIRNAIRSTPKVEDRPPVAQR